MDLKNSDQTPTSTFKTKLLGALIEFRPFMNSVPLRDKGRIILFKHYIIIFVWVKRIRVGVSLGRSWNKRKGLEYIFCLPPHIVGSVNRITVTERIKAPFLV